ncbi:uncharacterized protein LOC130711937 [Lotus japonicus]|uniref:uncharacterized protein LOC130711937 n=1 Tax=Lotus japonicus TaxID=34305 RepID=UPI0025838E4D|nr:uncharacterized protein LOC130711937 [Lotus japonicus]
MSLQALPQQQPVQPVQVYPDPVTNQQSPPSHHHSNGSFGTVFIVLAIILVISTVACFLGRLCNRRYNNNDRGNHNSRPVKPQRNQQQIHNFHPREGDIEFGVDRRIPPPIIGRPKGPVLQGEGPLQPPPNGNMRDFEMKTDHAGGELRAAA